MEREFIENPVVTRLGDGRYVAVYDSAAEVPAATAGALYIPDARNIGYSFSVDGVDWAPGRRIAVRDGGPGDWASDMRTPLGLIDEGKNVFTVLYTAERKGRKFWSVGMARVRMVG
jgi:hypothetical protein